MKKIEDKLEVNTSKAFESSMWIYGTKQIVDTLLSIVDSLSSQDDNFIQNLSRRSGYYYCNLCECNIPPDSCDNQQKLGKKHQRLLKARLLLQSVCLASSKILINADEVVRFIVRCCFDIIPKIQINHSPRIVDLKSLCTNLLYANSVTITR